MGFTIERQGFLSRTALFNSLIKDFAANGFTPLFYDTGAITDTGDAITAIKAVFEAGPTVDPLHTTQPWRIMLNGLCEGGQIAVATPYQFLDDGTVYKMDGTSLVPTSSISDPTICGQIGFHNTDTGIINDAYLTHASPYSYRLSITDRGFAVEFFQQLTLEDATGTAVRKFSWVCVQRLVNPITGIVQTTGRCPVLALYSCDSGKTAKRIVVREVDIMAPTQSVVVSQYDDYVNQVVNVSKQTVLAESNQYYIIFPSGFNTARHLYNEEMDMMAYTSAGVLSQFNDAVVNVYGRGTVAFTDGGNAPNVGDVITDPVTNATGTVYKVNLVTGTWEGGNAEGNIYCYNMASTTDPASSPSFISTHDIHNATQNNKVGISELDSQLEYRSYKGGCANIPDAEGMRALYLTSGGGI